MYYLEQMKDDIVNYIEEHEILVPSFDRDEIEEELNETLWMEDSVTGNASGSYTFNSYLAKDYVLDDGMKYIKDLVCEFGIDAKTVAEKFLNEEWEYWDVSIRCYLLPHAISEALDEVEQEMRVCDHCGALITEGFMDEAGFMHCCEDCFEEYMNETYGEGEWREVDDDGEGGYYECYDGEEWIGTGIFYTEWR